MQFILNDEEVTLSPKLADEPLLFVLRDEFGLNGPKFGCGVGVCGACSVIVDGVAQRSCTMRLADAAGARVVTLEGLAQGDTLHPVQQAWIDHSVPQCGYCQNGQIITAAALLQRDPEADSQAIAEAMDQVLCRCGTQARIRRAIGAAQMRMRSRS